MDQYTFLKKGQIMSFNENIELAVFSGEVWVTFEGDSQDYILKSNDQISTSRPGRIVVEGLENSSLVYNYSLQNPLRNEFAQAGSLTAGPSTRLSKRVAGFPATRGSTDQEQF